MNENEPVIKQKNDSTRWGRFLLYCLIIFHKPVEIGSGGIKATNDDALFGLVLATTILCWILTLYGQTLLPIIWLIMRIAGRLLLAILGIMVLKLPHKILEAYSAHQAHVQKREANDRIKAELTRPPNRAAAPMPIQEPGEDPDADPCIMSRRRGLLMITCFVLIGLYIGYSTSTDFGQPAETNPTRPTARCPYDAQLIEPCQFYYHLLTDLACY